MSNLSASDSSEDEQMRTPLKKKRIDSSEYESGSYKSQSGGGRNHSSVSETSQSSGSESDSENYSSPTQIVKTFSYGSHQSNTYHDGGAVSSNGYDFTESEAASSHKTFRGRKTNSLEPEDDTTSPKKKMRYDSSNYESMSFTTESSAEGRSQSFISETCPASSDSDSENVLSDSESVSSSSHSVKTFSYGSQERLDKGKQLDTSYVNNTAKNMMVTCSICEAKMGYQAGKGLGKNAQGRVEPIAASNQRGRRGLGLHIAGLEPASLVWDSSKETIEILETVEWIATPDHDGISRDDMDQWLVKGPKKLIISDEVNFIDARILKRIIGSKSVFDNLEPKELLRARSNSNPFETIKNVFFLNRAAVKMANMDARLDFMFTSPKLPNGHPAIPKGELLYFADVCAGPGGFSEYVLWRKQWQAKGFGFTLKGDCDFKTHEFLAGPPETFEAYYGVHDNGDVYNPENISSLKEHVLKQTDDKGVHFMMADGGFSVDGQENIQEILSKQLYLCQCLVALSIVRTDGHFLVKLFDLFTPFSVGLIYLMYKSFQEVCIMKPNTSRPANSERYLICKWKRSDCDTIERHLFEVNTTLWNYNSNSKEDINELVPIEVMQDDEQFFTYICNSNNSLGKRQIINLTKIAAFCRDEHLKELKQSEIRTQCLAAWKLEDKLRTSKHSHSPDAFLRELLRDTSDVGFLDMRGESLEKATDLDSIHSVYEWYTVPINVELINGVSTLGFYLGLGGNKIYRYENRSWVSIENKYKLELPRGTLIYGEIVQELRGQKRAQIKMNALHIIDAIFLGNIDVRNKYLLDRVQMCETFSRAITRPEHFPVRTKTLTSLDNFEHWLNKLEERVMKNGGVAMGCLLPRRGEQEELFYIPRGIIFLKITEASWLCSLSNKHKVKYYYNIHTRKSVFDMPKDACAGFVSSFKSRKVWQFESSMQALLPKNKEREPDSLHSIDIANFVDTKC